MFDKYITIFRITKAILNSPFQFGATLSDSFEETKAGARYVMEGVVFCLLLFQIITHGQSSDLTLLDLPFSDEIVGAIIVVGVLITSLTTHPIARFFSSYKPSIHASLAPFLYWTGFCLFIVPPVVALLFLFFQSLFSMISLSTGWQLLLFAILVVPLLVVYYLGTIASWIGDGYKIGPRIGGLAILFGYALSNLLSGVLMVIYYKLI